VIDSYSYRVSSQYPDLGVCLTLRNVAFCRVAFSRQSPEKGKNRIETSDFLERLKLRRQTRDESHGYEYCYQSYTVIDRK